MTRFHVRTDTAGGDRVEFDAEETRHLARVLRLGPGDLVQAVDGSGHELTVRLLRVESRAAEGLIVSRAARSTESPIALTLAQGIPKGDKLESVIRMATELGVQRIAPLITERTIARVDAARWEHRLARCRRVAKEAAKQSGRAVIPEIDRPQPLDGWVRQHRADLIVCVWEGARVGLSSALLADRVERASVVVGPEGGLSEAEVEALRSAGAVVAGLGPRILRTETAGPVAIALLQWRYGDLDPRP